MVFKKDKRHLKKKNIPLRNCEICNKIIPRNTKFGEKRIVPVQYIKTRFCSRKCKGIHHSQILQGKNNPNWQGGKSFEPYSVDWTQTLKRSIRERDNYICRICNQYGSSVHHKDYDNGAGNGERIPVLYPAYRVTQVPAHLHRFPHQFLS